MHIERLCIQGVAGLEVRPILQYEQGWTGQLTPEQQYQLINKQQQQQQQQYKQQQGRGL